MEKKNDDNLIYDFFLKDFNRNRRVSKGEMYWYFQIVKHKDPVNEAWEWVRIQFKNSSASQNECSQAWGLYNRAVAKSQMYIAFSCKFVFTTFYIPNMQHVT